MKFKTELVAIFMLFPVLAFPAFIQSDNDSFLFTDFLIDNLPGGFFYTTFMENYAPDTIFLIEENNGFALIDNPKVYFEGDSFIHFNWFWNDFNINSILDQGSPAVIVPFSSVSDFRLQGESPLADDQGFHFLSRIPDRNSSRLMVSSIYSDLGGFSPWASFLNSDPATERDDLLYSERRKMLSNFFIDYAFNKKFQSLNLTVALNYSETSRQFNDFNVFDQTFKEEGKLFLLSAAFSKKLREGFWEINAVMNYKDRSHLDAELGRYPQETFAQKKYSFFNGFHLKKKSLELTVSFLAENENRDSYAPDFSRDLMDNDGEGILAFGKIGTFSGNAVSLELDIPIRLSFISDKIQIKPYFDFRFSTLNGDELVHPYNSIYYNKNPYLVYRWEAGDAYQNTNVYSSLGLDLSLDISRSLSFYAKFWLNYNALDFGFDANDLNFWSPAFDAGVILFKNRKTEILVAYGQMPYETGENVNLFLESNRPSGTIYYWEDLNNDLIYQSGEEGEVYGYTGGKYHFRDEELSCPYKHRFLLNISTRISRNWNLIIKGIYKKIKNSFWVEFDQEYGFYENHDGYDLYFFDQPFQDFYLTNQNFDRDPFYAQLLVHLKGGVDKKWFFSFSFLAHMGMGYTAFGNGAGTNDIGIIDESQANPNSWINGFGRLDGDRAFVGRLYFGFYLMKDLFTGMALKYRDGNPFAFISSTYEYNQWVLYYSTIKAEDDLGIKGGPREDYLADISIQFNYRFRLFSQDAYLSLAFFNILDVGYELSEYVFSGGSRDAMELAIPKSLRLSLLIYF